MLMDEYGLWISLTWRKANSDENVILLRSSEIGKYLPFKFSDENFSVYYDIIKHGETKLAGTLGRSDSKPYAEFVYSIIYEAIDRENK
jgi:hypothetical protein